MHEEWLGHMQTKQGYKKKLWLYLVVEIESPKNIRGTDGLDTRKLIEEIQNLTLAERVEVTNKSLTIYQP